MRISQAAERTGSGRARRKIRETEILRAADWGSGGGGSGRGAANRASPVSHGAAAQCPAQSGSRLEVFNPEQWRFGFTADGRGTLHGCTRQLQLCVILLFESKIFKDPPPSPANWDECETDAADVASLSVSRGGLSHVSTVNHPHPLKSRATQSLADFVTQKTKKQSKLEEEMKKLVGCECAIDLCSAAVFPELAAEGGFLACE